MVKKNKKKKDEYVKKPSFKKYVKNIKSSTPAARKELYKIQKSEEKKYARQQAEIKAGLKDKKSINKLKKAASKFKVRGKILRKPTAQLPSYSARNFISNLAQSQNGIIREVENRYANPPQDNRSLYFKEEWIKSKSKQFGGFI